MIKVYNIWSRYGGCGYVRQYISWKINWYDWDYIELWKERTLQEKAEWALRADVIVFHRPDDPNKHRAAQIFKAMGKKIVFDNDDTILIDDRDNIAKYMQYQENLTGKMWIYDLVTCSTEFLKKEYEQHNKNVVLLPNCILPEDYPLNPQRNTTDKIRIWMVGSVLYKDDREVLQPIIEKLANRDDIQLVIFGLTPEKLSEQLTEFYKEDRDFWLSLKNIEWIKNVPIDQYIKTLDSLKLDLMIAPRKDNYFNRCKSNLKYLEASMLKIPFIGQSFSDKNSPYDKDIDWTNWILCDTLESWESAINTLCNNKELREKMGENAYNYVLKNYNIHDKAILWENAYKSLF